MFSTVLLFSNFVTADLRRLHMMRGIESAGKQQLITELKQLMAQKDAFMSSVSHELRTPLNGIIGEGGRTWGRGTRGAGGQCGLCCWW